MVELSDFPGPDYDCAGFYNELWVCFVDAEHYAQIAGDDVLMEPDGEVQMACQAPAPWHLSSLNVQFLPVPDGTGYGWDADSKPSQVYVLDTWVDTDHPEFEGRARRGPAFHTGRNPHGTHVSGLIGGKTSGVNKKVQLVSVQVLDSQGQGSWSTILKGLSWISEQAPVGIINISLAGKGSDIVDKVVKQLISRGWKVVVAAGNTAEDACAWSPARVREAVTVGAIDSQGFRAGFSNYGRCIDTFAPGQDILSAYPEGRQAYMSGTSMAAPIVAGIWAMYPNLSAAELTARTCRSGNNALLRMYLGTPPVAC
jgi:subtilisin family serine protease